MGYKKDHLKVMKVLGTDLPKRTTMSTKDIVAKGFKGEEDGDRRVRNAYRMLRKNKHIEIADRGEYRLTQSGVSAHEKFAADGWKVKEVAKAAPKKVAPKAKKAAPKAKKAAPKKAAAKKPATKKAAPKKDSKKASAKPATKVVKRGKMPSTGNGKAEPAQETKSAPTTEPKNGNSQLTF